MKNDQTIEHKESGTLKQGQVWALKDKCMEIKRVGKYLVEFMVTQNNPKAQPQEPIRVGKHLESIQAVQRFLQSHKAVLQGS